MEDFPPMVPGEPRALIITADDFGLRPSYDRGMIEVARVGAIDAASVMVLRSPDRIGELAATGVALGLHLEGRGAAEVLDDDALAPQLEAFERLAGRPPDYLDGHHHCHATPDAAAIVAEAAARTDLPVRSVGAAHRQLLRAAGVRTPDLFIGRSQEDEPAVPAELYDPPEEARSIEWMVHPGHPDPGSDSDYDRGRGEDLEALLGFELPLGLERADQRSLPRRR